MKVKVICPYCHQEAVLRDSIIVYRRSYGNIWICEPCLAWVGVHKGIDSDEPLGSLANEELRNHRKMAHAAFDPIWKDKSSMPQTLHEVRTCAYEWLAIEMDISVVDCHMAMFDVKQCEQVVEICKRRSIGHGGIPKYIF